MYSNYGWSYETLENIESKPTQTQSPTQSPIQSPTQTAPNNQDIFVEYNDIKIKDCYCKQNNALEFLSFIAFGTFVLLLVNSKK